MEKTIPALGRCLCGSVTIKAEALSTSAGACHCNICRKWGSGPLMALGSRGALKFNGEEFITRFSSSDWAERGFCGRCGTHLFYHLKGNDHYILSAGLFDAEPELHLTHQVFVDEKPAYYTFANETEMLTGAEVFAQFAAGEAES